MLERLGWRLARFTWYAARHRPRYVVGTVQGLLLGGRSRLKRTVPLADAHDVIAARCPSCHAAVSGQVEWCGLCYADLRPRPAPAVSAPVRPPAPGVPAGRLDALSAPIALLDPATASPTALPRMQASWPCPGCGAAVPLDLVACPVCALAFLAPLRAAGGVRLPVVGDLAMLSRGGRFGLAGGAALVLMAVFVGLAALAGLLL